MLTSQNWAQIFINRENNKSRQFVLTICFIPYCALLPCPFFQPLYSATTTVLGCLSKTKLFFSRNIFKIVTYLPPLPTCPPNPLYSALPLFSQSIYRLPTYHTTYCVYSPIRLWASTRKDILLWYIYICTFSLVPGTEHLLLLLLSRFSRVWLCATP